MPATPFNALILAGNRQEGDAVAALAGVSHKALVPINGIPMLLRLYRTLRGMPGCRDIHVCIDDAELLGTVPELASEHSAGRLRVVPPARSPAASLERALAEIGLQFPLLATTADHPLLSAAMVTHMLQNAHPDADLCVALAEAETVIAAYPGAIRTFYRFRGRRYSGCNLFLARTGAAARVAAYWQRMERHRKQPWRLIWEIGPVALLGVLSGRLSLESAFAHISRLTGAVLAPVILPFPEAPIDVDKASDFDLVTEILRQREGST